MLAIAARVAPLSLAGDEKHRRLTSLRYYWSCEASDEDLELAKEYSLIARRSVLFAAAIHNDSAELVWVRLLV